MIIRGQKYGTYVVLKQSGKLFEASNGKKIIRLSEAEILKGDWEKGELMMNVPQPEKKKTKTKKK